MNIPRQQHRSGPHLALMDFIRADTVLGSRPTLRVFNHTYNVWMSLH